MNTRTVLCFLFFSLSSFSVTELTKKRCVSELMRQALNDSHKYKNLELKEAHYCYFCNHSYYGPKWYHSLAYDKDGKAYDVWQFTSIKKQFSKRTGAFDHYVCEQRSQYMHGLKKHVSFMVESYWSGDRLYTQNSKSKSYY